MGKVVGIINHKGGSAKTTTALNLAGLLSEVTTAQQRKYKILLLDLDPQGSSIECIQSGKPQAGASLDELLVATPAGRMPLEPCIMQSAWEGISYVPTNSDRMVEANVMMTTRHLSPVTVLATLIKPILPLFDYIVIDTGPSQGMLMWNAIYATEMVIIPTQLDDVNVREVHRTLQNIKRMSEEFSHTPKILGILPTVYRKGVTAQERYLDALKTAYSTIKILEPIPVSTDIQEAYGGKMPLHRYNAHVPAVSAYVKLAQEVLHAH